MDIANHWGILDMLQRPAFCVRNGQIIRANDFARSLLFQEGMEISKFLRTDQEAYDAFKGGCLYLNVTSAEVTSGASVTRIEDFDLFVVDSENPQLKAFSLAAGQLKMPLCNLVNMSENLADQDSRYAALRGEFRKELYQLGRVINNMSDADWLRSESSARKEPTDFRALFAEIMEKMDTMVTAAGYQLEFTNLPNEVMGSADRELLLRGVSNILSNAVKFSPKGSIIRASLTLKDKYLHFSVTDPGDSQEARCDVFTRYARHAGIEDSRRGLGLGMSIIHSVATDHGGTVLVESLPQGTRVTMTMYVSLIKQVPVHTPVMLPVNNYTGGLDSSLVEFADVLPADAFNTPK